MSSSSGTPLVLRESLGQRLKILAILLGFVALGIWGRWAEALPGWVAWMLILFFGSGLPLWILSARRGGGSLIVDAAGIEIRTGLRSAGEHYAWRDIAGFAVREMRGGRFVTFDLDPAYQQRAGGRRLARALSGVDAMLPSTYGMGAEALAALLETHRARAAP